MPLSWNEIKQRAITFSKEWDGETREDAEAKSFWDGFFNVFGIKRRQVASFEEPVKNLKGTYSYIDLFWKKMLLAEHKSAGKDLGKAGSQAFQYIQDLANSGRQNEIPRYVILSDFERISLHDLEPDDPANYLPIEFRLADLHKNIHQFAFIPGYKQHNFRDQDPINVEAVEIMGQLHDSLTAGGYSGHDLERFLVRILFCLFAEDTGIFEREAFSLYIENRTSPDGSDLGMHLARLFEVLDCPPEKRQANLDETLAAFPYVNGALYSEHLGFADFNADMRNALVRCTCFDWSRISPAIFGSLFQAVMEPRARRQIGGHYTSERDILKVVRSLFLDDLWAEFKAIKSDRSTRRQARLEEFHEKLCSLHFFDPACGCGNFLIITYRELRRLELDLLKELFKQQREFTLDDVNRLSRVDVDQMFGIEIQEWPARIAEVALWLMDHLMNLEVSAAFGQLYQRLPLKKSPTIVCGNALRIDWKTVIAPEKCAFILGNPPFVGKHYQTNEQRADLAQVFHGCRNTGDIDFVTAWFYRASEFVQGTRIKVGFVATNSITQGEQVPVVWGILFERFKIKIHFAHRTFRWESEARGKAHVHVVIIGFGAFDATNKRIYDYEGEHVSFTSAANISPYLTPGSDVFITKRQKPLTNVPEMRCGNKPSDGGNFILTDAERDRFLKEEPGASKYLRRFTGSEEFINGNMRWCLWLKDANPSDLRSLPKVMERVERVKAFREKSTAEPTRKAAKHPTLFFYISQPPTNYILIPEVSSERRKYIPIGFMSKDVISANTNFLIESNSLFLYGILTSEMHMVWMRQVGGRLESRYRYSGSMIYNNFPWPQDLTEKQKKAVEAAAQGVLDARAKYPDSTLADLYDPLTMPPELVTAHAVLDKAVDKCYRPEPFENDRKRVEFLFALYEKITAPLITEKKVKKPRKVSNELT
jgi:hypothetical protein